MLHATFDVRQEADCPGRYRPYEERFPHTQSHRSQQADPAPRLCQAWHCRKNEGLCDQGAACFLCDVKLTDTKAYPWLKPPDQENMGKESKQQDMMKDVTE